MMQNANNNQDNTVANNISTYSLSISNFPTMICNQLSQYINQHNLQFRPINPPIIIDDKYTYMIAIDLDVNNYQDIVIIDFLNNIINNYLNNNQYPDTTTPSYTLNPYNTQRRIRSFDY